MKIRFEYDNDYDWIKDKEGSFPGIYGRLDLLQLFKKQPDEFNINNMPLGSYYFNMNIMLMALKTIVVNNNDELYAYYIEKYGVEKTNKAITDSDKHIIKLVTNYFLRNPEKDPEVDEAVEGYKKAFANIYDHQPSNEELSDWYPQVLGDLYMRNYHQLLGNIGLNRSKIAQEFKKINKNEEEQG